MAHMVAPSGAFAIVAGLTLAGFGLGQEPPAPDPLQGDIPVFGTTVVIPTGLRGAVYFLQEDTTRLPDFDKMQPAGYVYTNQLNITQRQFTQGFPGLGGRLEWFGIVYRGRFWVTKPGKYLFAMTSDDGARLYIDDKLVIDQDGVHAAFTSPGAYNLAEGLHRIRVEYFQGPRYELALVLDVRVPGEKWKIFNMTDFLPPSETDKWSAADKEAIKKIDKKDRLDRQLEGVTTADERSAIKMLATLPRVHDFDFGMAAYGFGVSESRSQTSLAFELPVSNLKCSVDPKTQARKFNVFIYVAVRDAAGRLVDGLRIDHPVEVPEAELNAFQKTVLHFVHPVLLPRGRYTYEVAVIDREGKTSSASVVEIDRSEIADGLGLSTPALIERTEPLKGKADPKDPFIQQNQRLAPMITKSLKPGMNPQVYFVVYPDRAVAEPPVMGLEFLVDGVSLAKQTAPLPPADATGAIPMMIAAGVKPGDCELRITISQGGRQVTRSAFYSVPKT